MKASKKTILHITPHFGGGVGSVLLNYLKISKSNPNFLHKVISFEYANDKALLTSQTTGFSLADEMSSNHELILKAIAEADIVLIHWWNHPLLYDFLIREELPPCRLIIWSHISGFHPPYIFTQKILQYPDIFVFTTPISLKTKEVLNLTDKQKKILRVVWSTSGIEKVKSVKAKKHPGFNIGYIGTVDYAKLHPNFLKICNKINIPDVKFIVCGGPSEEAIKKEAEKLGIGGKFNFTGPVSDITRYLSMFDLFGYPLAPYHYGTCDQALAESMAAGVVPVVFENRMEKYMVKDGATGIVAKNEEDYVKSIQELYKNKRLRKALSIGAKGYALKTFSIDRMAQKWDAIFKEILVIPKNHKRWNIVKKNNRITASDIFLESLGSYGKVFIDYLDAKSEDKKIKAIKGIAKLRESAIWDAETRGTIHHYNHFFSGDKYLTFWSKLMKSQVK